jgi:hypothetical protein
MENMALWIIDRGMPVLDIVASCAWRERDFNRRSSGFAGEEVVLFVAETRNRRNRDIRRWMKIERLRFVKEYIVSMHNAAALVHRFVDVIVDVVVEGCGG